MQERVVCGVGEVWVSRLHGLGQQKPDPALSKVSRLQREGEPPARGSGRSICFAQPLCWVFKTSWICFLPGSRCLKADWCGVILGSLPCMDLAICSQSFCNNSWCRHLWRSRKKQKSESLLSLTVHGCHALLQGIFLTLGIKPASLMSPALSGRFFTTTATWDAQVWL